MEKNRITVIDIAKGIGIILVIIGHIVFFGGFMHNLIFAFHMPFFFICSGLFFKKTRVRDLVKRKGKQLLVPYIVFCIIGLLLSLSIAPWRINISVKNLLKDIYLGCPEFVNVSSVWFLICLFFSMIFLDVILIINDKNCFIAYGILASIIISGFVFGRYHDRFAFLPLSRLPFDIDCACIAILFLWIGYFFRDRVIYVIKKTENIGIVWKIIGLMVSLSLLIFMVLLNGRVNLHGLTFNNPVLYIAESVIGYAFIIILSVIICLTKNIKNWLIWFGRNSLKIMGVQAITVRLFVLIVNCIYGENYTLYFIPSKYVVVGCAFSIIISGGVVTMINQIIKQIKKRGSDV